MADKHSEFNMELLKFSESIDRLAHRLARCTSPQSALEEIWDLMDIADQASIKFDEFNGGIEE